MKTEKAKDVIPIAYWGSPPYSALFLDRLIADPRFEIAFAVSQPDKPRSGRNREPEPTAVKKRALESNIPVYTPESLKKEGGQITEMAAKSKVRFHVVFAYGKIIPKAVFSPPPLGALNFHASLLPLLRGASPVESALLAGFQRTGWTIQKIESRMDAGDICKTTEFDIPWEADTPALMKLLIAKLLDFGPGALEEYSQGKLSPIQQDEEAATYCEKIATSMGEIDWKKSGPELRNMARAFQERPGIYTFLNGRKVKLWVDLSLPQESFSKPQGSFKPGEIVNTGPAIFVSCRDALLPVASLQPEGKKRLSASEFLNGYRIAPGDLFG